MSRSLINRSKNFIIIALLLTSIIQVGILWDIQNHGFPISFLTGLFTKPQDYKSSFIAAEAARMQYFTPYRVIVSDGFDGTYWITARSGQDYNELWAGGKDYLKGILSNNIAIGEPQIKETSSWWPEVFDKTSIIIDFKSELSKELLAMFLSTNAAQNINLPTKINKIVIAPTDDVNIGLNTIYLINNDATYRYTVQVKNERFTKEYFKNIIDKYSKELIAREYRSEKSFFKGTLPFKTSTDLLFSVTGNKYDKIKSIVSEPPDFLKNYDPDEAAMVILGDEKFSYYNTRQNDDTIELKNFNNSYRFSQDGIFEYKYLQNEKDFSKGNVDAAYEKAIKFMEPVKTLIKGAEICLTGLSEETDSDGYTFLFDYYVEGRPIFVNDDKGSLGAKTITNAVKIKASSKRVVSCTWLLKDFVLGKEKTYNVNHSALIDSLPEELGNVYRNNFSIADINIGYKIKPGTIRQEHNPVWGIDTLDGLQYNIEMEPKQ